VWAEVGHDSLLGGPAGVPIRSGILGGFFFWRIARLQFCWRAWNFIAIQEVALARLRGSLRRHFGAGRKELPEGCADLKNGHQYRVGVPRLKEGVRQRKQYETFLVRLGSDLPATPGAIQLVSPDPGLELNWIEFGEGLTRFSMNHF